MNATVLSSLNSALYSMMGEDERVIVMGEDLLDPYGGAFKVTRGLSAKFPERVFTTPISEAGFTGVAAGMAMRGLRPIIEIMFGDFLMLAADQVLNYITKCEWMYNHQAQVPIVIRTPMGARRGYGPTHSQTLEKHFIGMPGLTVVAANMFSDPGTLLRAATLEDDGPVLFIENKSLYSRPLRLPNADGRVDDAYARRSSGERFPTVTLSFAPFQSADVTLVAYGYMAELALAAARVLMIEDEIVCEVVVPSRISPLDLSPISESLARSGALVACEEGTETAGWCAEVIAQLCARHFSLLRSAPMRAAAADLPIAGSRPLETATLPQVEDLVRAARQVARPRRSLFAAGGNGQWN